MCNTETQIDIPPLNLYEDPKFDEILLENYENTLSRHRKTLESKPLTIETKPSKSGNPTQVFDSSYDVTQMTSKLKDPL